MRLFFVFLALWRLAAADLSVSRPSAGAKFSGNSGTASLEVEWQESGGSPALSLVSEYTFVLCSGPNSGIQAVTKLSTVQASSVPTHKFTMKIDRALVSNGMYFIQVVAVSPEFVTIHYSDRFTLEGMQGQNRALAVADSRPPAPEIIRVGGDNPPPPINSASFSIPYVSQTGSWRFAPMQSQPRATVTATTWTRQHPTSACTYFASEPPRPKWYTTVTPGWDYTLQMRYNDAHPAPHPEENGGWYNAASRKTLSARKINSPPR
ncbi:LAQU0S01e03312g1_1 [Lachancea quebecensis]|uniref:LAQU0S01e03312g1_1 n=1 Tax=Lachancea quebecensis TaxID=1654605 RepID=A0A0P1KNX3_9SACH|nr:LAQU0S01e03312g1_1 [Lachancea quebecensis]